MLAMKPEPRDTFSPHKDAIHWYFFGLLDFGTVLFLVCNISWLVELSFDGREKNDRTQNSKGNNFVRVMTKSNIWLSMINSIHK